MASFFLQLNELLKYGYVKAFLIFFIYTWVIWLSKVILSLKYKPVKTKYRPSFQVIVPVYKENLSVFDQCLKSIVLQKPSKLIVAIDGGDVEMIKIAQKYTTYILALEKVGKRKAMLAASELLDQSEVTIVVDSDTIWTSSTLNLLNPFRSSKVGGVTGKHIIFNETGSITRLCADWLEQIRFDLVVPAQSVFGKVFCLPGRTMAFRTSIFKLIIPIVANKKILGLEIIIGDDRDLTSETLSLGYKTVYQSDSLVLTDCPNTLLSLSAQQLRWYRSVTRETLRQFFLYLREAPLPLLWSLDFILSPVFLTGIIASEIFKRYYGVYEYIPLAFVFDTNKNALWLTLFVVLGFFVTYYIRQLPHLLKRPQFFWYLPLFVFITWVFIFPVKLLALFTFLEQGWNTRKSAFRLTDVNIMKARLFSMLFGSLLFIPLFLFGFFNDLNLTGLNFSQLTSNTFTDFYSIDFWQDSLLLSLQNVVLIGFIVLFGAGSLLAFTHRHNFHFIRQLQLKIVSISVLAVVILGACIGALSVQPILISSASVAGTREQRDKNTLNYRGQYVDYVNGNYIIKQLVKQPKIIMPEVIEIYNINNKQTSMSEREKTNLNSYLRVETAKARREGRTNAIIDQNDLNDAIVAQ